MRKLLLGSILVLAAAAFFYFRFHGRGPQEIGYAATRDVNVWSTSAPVRELVSTAHYGDRLEVLARSGNFIQVRELSGATGWIDKADLLSLESWNGAKALLSETEGMKAQAAGETHVLANLHLGPFRKSPTIWQLSRTVPVALFERRVTPVAPAEATPEDTGPDAVASSSGESTRREDWWLVRARVPQRGEIAGWLLGKFIDLDVPAPLPDYASSAGMRIVAWFELGQVPDGSGGTKPQYLVVGTRSSEGQPCDFTMMRAYTWSKAQQQYETAFTEAEICGNLPVRVTKGAAGGSEAYFDFAAVKDGQQQLWKYRMRQTIIRRIEPEIRRSKVPHRH